MFEYKDASNGPKTTERLCPFCETDQSSRCDDTCPSRIPEFRQLINNVRELLLATEYLYKQTAHELEMENRLQLEDAINGVIQSVRGIK